MAACGVLALDEGRLKDVTVGLCGGTVVRSLRPRGNTKRCSRTVARRLVTLMQYVAYRNTIQKRKNLNIAVAHRPLRSPECKTKPGNVRFR